MRRRHWSARGWLALAALAALAGGGSCVGRISSPKPTPTLASTPQASAAFQAIREAWRSSAETSPAMLRALLERFIARFPDDGLVPLARVYLALVAMKQTDFSAADRQLALVAMVGAGTTRDMWTIATARRVRLKDNPEAALELLRPLVGRSVDPIERAVFEEELTLAALATHRDYEAISYMDAWLRASSEEEREDTARAVASHVERLPTTVLVGALQAMRVQRASFGYGVEIERILANRLVQIATATGDAELARLLLDSDGGAIAIEGDAGMALGELAMSRRGLNVVEGRTIGLLLPTDSPGLRDESADALRGVMWALGLPRGVRSLPQPASRRGAPTFAARVNEDRTACAPRGDAPALDEPLVEEGVRLVTRDDAGSADRTEVALDELAGEGAAIVIAGLDPQTAARALRWGAEHHVSVIALVAPAAGAAPGRFGFLLGEPRANVLAALTRAIPSLARGSIAPVVDASEVPDSPVEVDQARRLALTPPVSCDIPAARAGEPRFPIVQWDQHKTNAWLVSGSPACARDLVTELSEARVGGVVALTLEAAALLPHSAGLRLVSASAGVVPEIAPNDARDDELRRFAAALGHVTWWTALGRDATTLARLAVRGLPDDVATSPRTVFERRVRASELLATSRARLWTTESTSWTDSHVMSRTVCALDVAEVPR